jgi:hypothetical protein
MRIISICRPRHRQKTPHGSGFATKPLALMVELGQNMNRNENDSLLENGKIAEFFRT